MKAENEIANHAVRSACALVDTFALKINAESSIPLYRQLCDQLKQLIVGLNLMRGELLPSTRELAVALGVSRKTICRCYEELLSQGYLKSEVGVGTFVNHAIPGNESVSSDPAPIYHLTQYAENLLSSQPEPSSQGELPELHFGAPPASQLPVKAWRQVLLKQLRNDDFKQFYYDTEPFGYLPLRSAIASYLMRSRALQCDPEQIVVFSHALSPLRLFARIVVDEGDSVVVENPGFPFARRVFAGMGAKLIPRRVDEHGLCVDDLEGLKEQASLVYVTPSHQDPTGAMMTLDRRKKLLGWAKANNCFILEDDYDCEFRYTGSTLPSLMALDEGQNVAYIGDMWKTLFPLVNIGYLVLPEKLVDIFKHAQSLSWTKASTSLPFFDQLAVTEFLNEGYFERHIRKTRTIYASRYRNLVVGITRYFGDLIECAKDTGSMQLLVKFKVPISDVRVQETAKTVGLAVVPTKAYYCEGEAPTTEFLIAFVALGEDEMMRRLERWAGLLFVDR